MSNIVSRRRISAAVAGATLSLIGLAASACSSGASGDTAGAISVVASTSVYGDITAQIAGTLAGRKVKITSIISDPHADPHSYEANTRDALAISRADLVIENGGGYDDFMNTMRSSAGGNAKVLDAVDVSGKKAAAGSDLNEHVWYDVVTVQKLAVRITDDLVKSDPADAGTFRANARGFAGKLGALAATEARIKAAHAGTAVAVTEPVPLYLLEACGLVNKTPLGFSHAVEAGTDVSPRVLQQTEQLFSGRQVALLAYNEQTSDRQTDQVLAAARSHGIPVVPVTETLPAGKNYVTWMAGNLAAVKSAVG